MSSSTTCPHCAGILFNCYCPPALLSAQREAAARASLRRTSTRSMSSARSAVARLKEIS